MGPDCHFVVNLIVYKVGPLSARCAGFFSHLYAVLRSTKYLGICTYIP